jgi:hypothetical protein
VVSANGSLVVWDDFSGCFERLGFSIGIADSGLNRAPMNKERCAMFEEKHNAPRPTLLACLILLLVLAAVAVMSAESGSQHRAVSQRIASAVPGAAGQRFLASLEPLNGRMAGSFPADALVTYDIGVAPETVFEAIEAFLESSLPELSANLEDFFADFQEETGLSPTQDLLSHLEHGLAVGLLPPEDGVDRWPFPRKVVIMRVSDADAVSRFLEAWIHWEAGAIAPMTQGFLGASVRSDSVGGYDVVGLQLAGILPVDFPLPSPSYSVAGDFLVMSPVRSAVVETLGRLEWEPLHSADTLDGPVVEEVWLNFPAWPHAWRRAEPYVEAVAELLNANSPVLIQMCRAVAELVGEFEPGFGTTSITQRGGLVFRFEIDPPARRAAAPEM